MDICRRDFFLPLPSPNGRSRHDGRPDTLAAAVGARSVHCRFPERHKTLTFSWIRSSMVLGSSLGSRLERCAPTEDTVNRTTANYRLFYQSVGRVPRKYRTYTVVAQWLSRRYKRGQVFRCLFWNDRKSKRKRHRFE